MRLLKIGRDEACDIVLRSNKVSALHAEITLLNNGDILLEDKNSLNGTFIMNRPIKPGETVSIKRGDAIRFGDTELEWSQIPMPENNSNYKAIYGIGTNFRNEIQIAGNTVSRFHATLKVDKKGKAYIIDHSKNGTTVNGKRINSGKPYLLKRSDAVVCGGEPVDLRKYIPSDNLKTVLAVAASVIILAGLSYIIANIVPWPFSKHVDTQNASVCVYGAYYYVVTINDDPFKKYFDDWPDKWYIGRDGETGKMIIRQSKDEVRPYGYTATAFFISENGELGTNRHVAVPWDDRSEEEDENIRQLTARVQQSFMNDGRLDFIKEYAIATKNRTLYENVGAWSTRFLKSDITISGVHAYLGIGLTGSKVEYNDDLLKAQVIAESGDPKKDAALIRLNTRKTPDYIIKKHAIYDIPKARVDENTLQTGEELMIVGYPKGESVSNVMFNGQELHPTTTKVSISRVPDENQFQIQAIGMGGMSGSPVCDKNNRLVGILYGGFGNTDVTFCCNIKHLVELYNKNKVRE